MLHVVSCRAIRWDGNGDCFTQIRLISCKILKQVLSGFALVPLKHSPSFLAMGFLTLPRNCECSEFAGTGRTGAGKTGNGQLERGIASFHAKVQTWLQLRAVLPWAQREIKYNFT
jgi:hypothetical protein